mgnify:CR=1 FL=1
MLLSLNTLLVPMSPKSVVLVNVAAQENLPVSRSILPVALGTDKNTSYGYDHASVKQMPHSPQSEYTALQLAGEKVALEKLQTDLKEELEGWLLPFQQRYKTQQKEEVDRILADPLTDALATIKTADIETAIDAFDRFSNGILWPDVRNNGTQVCTGNIQTNLPANQKRTYTEQEYAVAENLLKSRDDYKAYVAQQEQLNKQREEQQKRTPSPDLDMDMLSTSAYSSTHNISLKIDQRITNALNKIDVKTIDDLPQFLDAVGQTLNDLEQQGLLAPEEQINALVIMVGTYLQDMADTGKWKDNFVEFVEQQGQSMRDAANAAYKDFREKNPELNLPEGLDYGKIEELDQIISSTIDEDLNLSPEEKVYVDRARHLGKLTRTGFIYAAFLYTTGKLGAWEAAGFVNTTTVPILKNGYYEVNGFKFTEYYYNRLWKNGRHYPGLRAESILKGAEKILPDPKGYPGFYKYIYDGWEMVYNPSTKIVSHLSGLKNK